MQEIVEKRDNKTKKTYSQAAVRIFLLMIVTRPILLNDAEFENGAVPVIDPKKKRKGSFNVAARANKTQARRWGRSL